MLKVLFDFAIQLLQFFSGLFSEIAAPRTWSWSVPLIYTGIPVLDTYEGVYIFPSGIPGFPYSIYPDGLVPQEFLSGQAPLYSIEYEYTGNFLNLALIIIGSVFLGLVVWNIIKKATVSS